ncbi:ester cyclase [Bacillus solimangrovi]|uniref:SnoaL-like domain-containing protein n=1 Tax=Bacillus solimangrovi TaxID=1305675 RepID=A0A1E5LIG0_9BACI|nr:ester cyclase [Bacillus solimangrovi]OEH93836.1 hypothetical protein BFG57_10975 [Bacillus solimangrovi]
MENLTRNQAREIIQPFYNLFCEDKRDWEKGFAVLDNNWKGYFTNNEWRGKRETREFLQEFFEHIPDIQVRIIEVLADGNSIAVRSELKGTPKSDFLVPYSGRSFSIMTLDIHRVRNGKIIELFHCEDWETAAHQLSGEG